jgi:hypothetical protein
MNTLSNLDTYFIPNTLDGINAIDETISEVASGGLQIDGTNKMLADIDVNSHNIKNLVNGVAASDAVNYSQLSAKADATYVDARDALKLDISGGTLTGQLSQNIGNNNIQYGGNNLIYAEPTTKQNVAIGINALKIAGHECFNNTAVGNNALIDLFDLGRYNTAIGHSAGEKAVMGSFNQYFGYQAGLNSYTDVGCTYVGHFSGRDDPTPPIRYGYQNSTALGTGVTITGSNQIRIGTASETTYFDGNVIIQTPTDGSHPTTKIYVDGSLNIRPVFTYVDGSLNLKANITDMNTADNLKINKAGDTMTGTLILNGGTATGAGVDALNLSNTYIKFGEAGATTDWAYLRQIGGSNNIQLSLDFHDDLNDGKFSLRSIQSTSNPDIINEFFYASPTKTKIGSYLDMSNNTIVNVANGVNANDAVNKSQLDTKINTAGGVMTGDLDMNSHQIKNVLAGTSILDAVNMYQLSLKADSTYVVDVLALKAPTTWVESQISACVKLAGSSMYGNLITSESISVGKHLAVSGYTQYSNETFTAGADIYLSINTKTYNTFTVPSGVTQNFILSDDFMLTIPVGCVYHFKNLGQGNLVIKTDFLNGATLDGDIGTTITLSSAYTPTNNALYDGVTIHYYGLGQYASYGKTRNKTTYRNGEIIKSVTWNYNTLTQSNTSFGDDTTLVWTAFYYTPQSSNSTLVLHADADFYWSGSGTDRVYVIVKEEISGVNTQKYTKAQFSVSAGGLRSFAPLFPLVATWSSSSTAQRLIRIYIDMKTADLNNNNDTASMNSNNFSITLHEIQN